jgi:ADP-heptose:LPS heptosyltransferase
MEDAVSWQRKLAEKAQEFEPDAFFNLSHSCETVLAFLEGQTDFWRPAAVRRKLCDDSYLGRVHDLCGLPRTFDPRFFPTAKESVQAHDTRGRIMTARRGPVVGWCLSGSRRDKIYPYSHVVIARLIAELGANVVMFGAPVQRDHDLAKQIETDVITRLGGPAGLHTAITVTAQPDGPKWPVRRILTQLQHCDLVIGPDTGPLWAVAMEHVPKIVLLSHASERNITEGWRLTQALSADPALVPCYPCHRLHDRWETCVKPKDLDAASCMASISPQRVIEAAAAALNGRDGTIPPFDMGQPEE